MLTWRNILKRELTNVILALESSMAMISVWNTRRYASLRSFRNAETAASENISKEKKMESTQGAPNDQFVVKCIIIPQLMKINVIKAFSGVFQCCWENIICSFFPARHTRNFPAS